MFVKFVRKTLDSSLNDIPEVETRWTFFTVCLLADWEGYFTSTIPGIARHANLPVDAVRLALETLQAPDPESTTPDDDGVRVRYLGNNRWHVVNILKYRTDDDLEARKSADRERQRRHREKARDTSSLSRDVTLLSRDGHAVSRHKDKDIDLDQERTDRTDLSGPAVADTDRAVKKGKPEAENNQVKELFDFWVQIMDKKDPKLSPTRKRRIEWALKEYGFERARLAIIGCASSAFNMGDNDRDKPFNDLELIFRNAEKFEAFEALGMAAKTSIDAETGKLVVQVSQAEGKSKGGFKPGCDQYGREYGVLTIARERGVNITGGIF